MLGWYTLHWGREGDAWKLRLWTWQRGGAVSERETWNEIFRNNVGFEKDPNRLLVEITRGVKRAVRLRILRRRTGRPGRVPGELAKLFADGFTIVRDDTVEDRPDWAIDRANLVRFVARKNR